jgi:hypothetical protein
MNEDATIQEQISAEEESYGLALQNEQAMMNMCSPENRSI